MFQGSDTAYTLGLRLALYPADLITMSESTRTQDIDEQYENHAVTNGSTAKYLQDENPNAPVADLADRYRNEWDEDRRKESLPGIRAPIPCPDCGSSHVFYTDKINVARCDSCGLRIADTYKTADEILEGR